MPALIKNWDTSFALGGPIVKDRLWFFGNVRTFGTYQRRARHATATRTPANPNAWSYVEDRSLKVAERERQEDRRDPPDRPADAAQQARLLLRLPEELHGLVVSKDGEQCRQPRRRLDCARNGGFDSGSPESGNVWDDREKIVQASWSSPVTNKLLLEAGFRRSTAAGAVRRRRAR